MDPVKLFTVIVLISLPTVMFGGYALLDLLSKEKLTEFQRTYFRAGHAHAGVLLVMTLVALAVLDGTEFGDGARWVACILLAVGVLAQSGGMFLHMAIGKPGAWSRANTLTTAGAVALAAGMQVPGSVSRTRRRVSTQSSLRSPGRNWRTTRRLWRAQHDHDHCRGRLCFHRSPNWAKAPPSGQALVALRLLTGATRCPTCRCRPSTGCTGC